MNAFATRTLDPRTPVTRTQAPPATQSASPWNMNQEPVNAFGSDQPMTMPKPKPTQGNALADGFKAFATGFAGEEVAASDARREAAQKEQLTKTLTWLQQTAAQQSPEARAQFTMSNAEAIARDTGQPLEAVMASVQDPAGFSDQAMQQGIAGLSAQLGIAPAQPADTAPIKLGNTDRLVDPRTNEVLVDALPKEQTPANWRTAEVNGRVVAYNPQNPSETRDMGAAPARSQGIRIGPDGSVTIGGPAADGSQLTGPSETEGSYYKDVGAYQSAKEQRETMLNNLAEAKKLVNGWTTGVGGAVMRNIPGSPAVDLQQRITTVQALIGFDALNEMRQNSPTGGALGQVTERELAFLQAVRGSLATVQSEQQLLQVMGEIEASIGRLATAQDQAFNMRYQSLEPGETRSQPRRNADGGFDIVPGAVEDGYRFKGGDAGDPNNWEPVQ